MINKHKDEQFLVTSLLNNEIINDRVVQAYMFFGDNIDYLYEFAIDFSKTLICQNMDSSTQDKICKRIDNGIYNELKTIEPINNMIRKERFINLQKELSLKPIEGSKIIYIIKECDKLNIQTANAMLKFIEDANNDVIAIFLTTNIDNVISTIKSRCQIIKFKKTTKFDIFDIIKKEFEKENNDSYEDFINSCINFIKNIEKKGINSIYSEKEFIIKLCSNTFMIPLFLNFLLYFYYDLVNHKINRNLKYNMNYEDIIMELSNSSDLDKLIKKMNIIEEIIDNNNFNLNSKLLFDRLIIQLSEV